ncbi:hypothetical protein Geob_0327 [Geotalea daltonii FRC-32]|uniref:Uncharacterized protein n=1 Tax=Geotalea daltonii (strain DSM 22248 / JCM 15807 / FRC-32) TaxID=316067 RepID=B9M9E0_GEODF|nr:DUF2059 domain-containing protein [Geotalea daltonii]ACM18698.1 hypothetical protein Geob_0327 [Geotalea daltonii FRC-32]
MYNIRLRTRMIFLAVTLAALCPAILSAAEKASQTATSLVNLVKPHEREAQAIRFMLVVAPMGFPEGLADCMVAKTTPAIKDYFAALYAAHLSETELRQAVDFFKGEDGRAAVAFRLQHEQNLLNASAKGEQITNEHPEYPLQIRKALEAFSATPAGRHFVGDELEARQPFASEISELRNAGMAQCLADLSVGVGNR